MTTATLDFDQLVLTDDQQAALEAFTAFLMDPTETVFVLSGYSGCGKSTLVRSLLERLPKLQKMAKLINPKVLDLSPELTATTNKAAENLAHISGYPVRTIHSFLGLRVETDFKTRVTRLVPSPNFTFPESVLLFIDEASFLGKDELGFVFSRTKNCKVVFIGDPAQLAPVKSSGTPVFDAGFTGAALTTVVRQAEGNPIVALSTLFRHVVNTGEWSTFTPDGHHIKHMDRNTFNAAIEAEFTHADWTYSDSKILAWTNKRVEDYNKYVRGLVKGDPNFAVGDYAVCNKHFQLAKGYALKTDQLIQITGIEPDTLHEGVTGNWVSVNHIGRAFLARSLTEKKARLKLAYSADDMSLVCEIEESWIDLRAVYAQTINKSQGSTYGSVFIDLDDIRGCNSGNQIARMLYVAVSRAKNHVYLTGDLA